MKKIIILLLILSFTSTQEYSFWAEESSACEEKKWYARYTCRVKQICTKYDTKKPVWRGDNYEDASTYNDGSRWLELVAFDRVKSIYRTNIGNIYKCALINSQKNVLKNFKEKLVKLDTTWTLENSVGRQMDEQLQKADTKAATIWCQNIESKEIYNKLNILNESTLEMCKYVTYLEYLGEHYKEINNVVWEGNQQESVQYENAYVADVIGGIQEKISGEISHSLEVMPIAFNAYKEYENNLPAHILLQIIREDYVIIREKLQKAMMPIAQVVYKISNAMQK